MGDNHVVAGAIPAIETICFAPALGWDATLRRSLEKVQFLPVVLRGPSSLRRFAPTDLPQHSPPAILRHRLGRVWSPKPGSSVRFTGGVLRLIVSGRSGRRVV